MCVQEMSVGNVIMEEKEKSEARKRYHCVCSTKFASKNAKLGFIFELFGSTKIGKMHSKNLWKMQRHFSENYVLSLKR